MTSALSLGLILKDTPFPTSCPIGNKDDEGEIKKEAKDIHSCSHGPDSILSQVPPEKWATEGAAPKYGLCGLESALQ